MFMSRSTVASAPAPPDFSIHSLDRLWGQPAEVTMSPRSLVKQADSGGLPGHQMEEALSQQADQSPHGKMRDWSPDGTAVVSATFPGETGYG